MSARPASSVRRRTLRMVLAVGLVLVGAHLCWVLSHGPSPSTGGVLMPAAGGPVQTLGIQFHRVGASIFLPVLGDILATLDSDATVLVTVGDAEDREIFAAAMGQRLGSGGPRLRYVEAGRPITSWARDRLAVLEPTTAGAPTTLLAPPVPMAGAPARVNDWVVPWATRRGMGAAGRIRAAPFAFEGGDLIGDGERVYLSSTLLARNLGRPTDELLDEVEATVGLPVLALGADGTPVPEHHIGMFLTPLGGGRVAYGDPDLALAALRSDGWTPGGELSVGGQPLEPDLEHLQPFRNVRRLLEEAGLEPVAIPILPSTATYAWLSYNNDLLQYGPDGRLHVTMPTYGLPALDAAARRAWEREGAVVHGVDVSGLFRLGGSVRCLVAPLQRAPLPSVS